MSQASGLKNTLFVHFLTKAQRCYSAGLLAICCSGAVFPSLHSGGSWHIVFFFCSACLHLAQPNWQVFLISALMGSQQNKQTWPPAPCLCRCALSHSQMDLSCLPAAAWGSEPHREHVTHTHTHANSTHKRWLSKPNRKERHYWDKYVSAWGLGCYHPIGKAVVVWGKKTTTSAYWFWQSVCWLVPNVFSYNHTDAVEFVKNETEWFMLMMFDSSCIKPSQSSVCRVF